ncbi:MAG: hypothetical protein OQK69_08250 [Gammaproteobacteria bacterium]|nr:hypothetical protein [Gammaproteobacteria bacterium]
MKKHLVFIFLGMTALPVSGYADNKGMGADKGDCPQPPNCQQHDPKQHMTQMLSLREDQIEAVMKVLKSSHEKRMSMRQADRQQHEAIYEQTLQQLEPLLDNDQMARFVSFSEKMKKQHQQRMGRGGDGSRSGR